MDELITEFIEETVESLAEVELDLVGLEQNPDQPGTIDQLFRIVHTIKGTCSFINLTRLGNIAHAAENLLGLVRDGQMKPEPQVITAVLEAMDQIRVFLDEIEASGKEPDVDVSGLIAKLEAVAAGETPAAEEAEDEPEMAEDFEGADAGDDAEDTPAAEAPSDPEADEGDAEESESVQTDGGDNRLVATLADILASGKSASEALEEMAGDEPVRPEPGSAPKEVVSNAPKAKPKAAAAPARSPAAEETDADGARQGAPRGGAQQGLRVSVDLIEQLMTLVSELVLTRNQLLQLIRNESNSVFKIPCQRLSHITAELQEGVMKTRMQPIGNAWNKLPRIVRDLGIELGKKIELQMEGADTELDRQVLDMIKDPLTHMVRNSADHGIEMPSVRAQNGKPETGTIKLSARHEGGHIVIELADDGAGLNAEAIGRRVIERNLASAAEVEAMDDGRLFKFIFEPGFSTAAQVSNVSGRGVGMDVVRTNIERIGGSIDLQSQPGQGTRLNIKIPLTLAIVSALIVESGDETFAIPQISVQELVRINETSEHRIEMIDGSKILRLRQRLLPLINLDGTLALEGSAEGERDGFVVVCQVGTQLFGVIVDQVFDTEEIVVKPVAPILRDNRMFSGNTILGDGRVIMILDPNGLATTISARPSEKEELKEADAAERARKTTLLSFEVDEQPPQAVPLSLVDRLENFSADRFEILNGKVMVQYRGQLMPVVTTDCKRPAHTQAQQVIVFSDSGQYLGLAVDRIVDINDAEIRTSVDEHEENIMGNAVIGDKATEVLDIAYYMRVTYPDLFSEEQAPYATREERQKQADEDKPYSMLLVDDSSFFRNLVGPLLASHGFKMTVAKSGTEVLELLEQGAKFDIAVSDIEMPEIDGYGLLAKMKRHPSTCDMPVIALTSHCTEADRQKGMKAGFSGYVAKLDKSALIKAINHALQEMEKAA